jgi:hypothetical protein
VEDRGVVEQGNYSVLIEITRLLLLGLALHHSERKSKHGTGRDSVGKITDAVVAPLPRLQVDVPCLA